MYMVCPDIDRQQLIAAMFTYLTDCLLYHGSLVAVECDRRMLQQLALCFLQPGIGRNTRSAVVVLLAIDRAALVAVQPGTVGSKGDEVSERKFVIVKISNHGREVSFLL